MKAYPHLCMTLEANFQEQKKALVPMTALYSHTCTNQLQASRTMAEAITEDLGQNKALVIQTGKNVHLIIIITGANVRSFLQAQSVGS